MRPEAMTRARNKANLLQNRSSSKHKVQGGAWRVELIEVAEFTAYGRDAQYATKCIVREHSRRLPHVRCNRVCYAW